MTKKCEEKRELIVETAMRLILHYGFAKTTMQDIATEAGMSVGSLYNFFKSKEDICAACAEDCKLSVFKEMEKVSESELMPEKKLNEMMLIRNLSYFEHFSDTPHGMEIVSAMFPKLEGIIKKFAVLECELIERVITEGAARGDFYVEDATTAASTFRDAFSGFIPPLSINLSEDAIREGTVRMVSLLIRAFRAERKKAVI
jgi:AcrR family transcriptional regulator